MYDRHVLPSIRRKCAGCGERTILEVIDDGNHADNLLTHRPPCPQCAAPMRPLTKSEAALVLSVCKL